MNIIFEINKKVQTVEINFLFSVLVVYLISANLKVNS